jgi:hypothetical protein
MAIIRTVDKKKIEIRFAWVNARRIVSFEDDDAE